MWESSQNERVWSAYAIYRTSLGRKQSSPERQLLQQQNAFAGLMNFSYILCKCVCVCVCVRARVCMQLCVCAHVHMCVYICLCSLHTLCEHTVHLCPHYIKQNKYSTRTASTQMTHIQVQNKQKKQKKHYLP